MDISFVGKTALVTGAGKGIGRETSKLLAKCGANIIALTRTQSDLDSLKKEIPNLQTICVDLLNIDEAVQAVEAAGPIDLLVNNAALLLTKSCLDVTKDDMDKSMLVNVTAPLLLSQVVAKKLMKAGKSGTIVNISTSATYFGSAGLSPYVCSNSALESITRTLALKLAPHQIRVNSVLPGAIYTARAERMCAENPELEPTILARVPMNRMGKEEELAHTVAYLLSDKSSYITGQCIGADGGYMVN